MNTLNGIIQQKHGIYVNVMEVALTDNLLFESHHKYVDIHYPLSGSEQIADETTMEVTKDYDEEMDYILGITSGIWYKNIKNNHSLLCQEKRMLRDYIIMTERKLSKL